MFVFCNDCHLVTVLYGTNVCMMVWYNMCSIQFKSKNTACTKHIELFNEIELTADKVNASLQDAWEQIVKLKFNFLLLVCEIILLSPYICFENITKKNRIWFLCPENLCLKSILVFFGSSSTMHECSKR